MATKCTCDGSCMLCDDDGMLHPVASGGIVDEPYDAGVPGRACLACNSAWPATESDGAYWHHVPGCANAVAT